MRDQFDIFGHRAGAGGASSMATPSRGPARRPDLLSIVGREQARAMAERWRAVARLLDAGRMIPHPSRRIIDIVCSEAVPACFALAWCFCRWSELKSVNLGDLAAGREITLRQEKQGTDRRKTGIPPAFRQGLKGGAYLGDLGALSYYALNREIRRATAVLNIGVPVGIKDGTHIFRHIHASWRVWSGYTPEEASAEFGHFSKTAIEGYIHDFDCFNCK